MNIRKKNKIAVIGLDCKLPGQSHSPDQFWEALLNKKNGIVPIPDDRWEHSFYYDSEGGKGKTYVNRAGFISDVFDFSPSSFGMSEKEAAHIDPQQRLLIQSSWNSIQNAGYKIQSIKEKTGVFFGLSYRDYYDFDIAPNGVEGYTAANPLGNSNAIAVGRVAYLLGLQGPAIQVDTICSSSLMTLHLACQSLVNEECDYALSGGANCILSPHALVALSQMGALSKTAKCQTFSKHADGYIRGEGVGVLLLKRLEDAERDGDYIYGVVEATATNHDGRSNGLTAPNGKAQVKLIESCLEKANLSPKDIGYIEAHGTGTYLGDPVELESLYQVFGDSISSSSPLFIGSVKSNIGHLEPAAGVASLIKALLILKNKMIPAGLHLEELNPAFKWSKKPIVPVKENMVWKNDDECIGVSAFSMTGANVHVILGKAPKQSQSVNALTDPSINKWPIILSAQNETKLHQYISSLIYSTDVNMPIDALSNTFTNGREVFQESIYTYVSSTQDLIKALERYQKGVSNAFQKVSLKVKRKSEHIVINIENFPTFNLEYLKVWEKEDLFALSITKINHVLAKLLSRSLTEITTTLATELEQKIARFSQAFIWVDTVLSTVKTDVLLNTYGEGDYMGAVFSELLTIEESLMLFILNDEKRIQLLDRIRFNTSNNCWNKSETASKKEFWVEKKEYSSTKNINANILNDIEQTFISQTDTVDELYNFLLYSYAKGVEIDWTLFLGNIPSQKVALPPPPLVTKTYISESYKINSKQDPKINENRQRISKGDVISSILHHQLELKQNNIRSFSSSFSPEQNVFIRDHIVNGIYIFPGSGYISMACEALFYLHESHPITLENVQIFQPMSFSLLDEKREVKLDLNYDKKDSSITTGYWEIISRKWDEEEWVTHIKGGFKLHSDNRSEKKIPEVTLDKETLSPVDIQSFYGHLSDWGIKYGREFRLVKKLESNESSMKALVQQESTKGSLQASPELLDACMHALFSAKMFQQFSEPFVPSRYDEINIYRPLQGSIHASGVLLDPSTNAMKGKFSFCDSKGEPIIEIKAMEVRKILSQFLENSNQGAAVYNENWEIIENDLELKQTKRSKNEALSNNIWVFLNFQQAQQVSTIVKTTANPPEIVVIGNENNTLLNQNTEVFKTISDVIKNKKEDGDTLFFFAPPIKDTKQLSLVFGTFKDLLLTIPKHIKFRLCTVKGIAVNPEEKVNPLQTALWGLARTMPIEAKQKWEGVIDIPSTDEVLHLLDSQLQISLTKYDQLALRNKNVYTPTLIEENNSSSKQLLPYTNWTTPVLITGGLGQMGRVFTKQLVALGCREIYLMSRNTSWIQTEDNQTETLNLSPLQQEFCTYVKSCKSKGISISAISGNVSSEEDMEKIAKRLEQQGVKEINIIHAAGSITRKNIIELERKELEQEWKTKYEGALLLDKHFGNFNVGFTLYTSSIASLWSGEGVAGYSSANLLLDGLAINRNCEGKRTISVRFGRFVEKGLMKEDEAQELEASGILAMPMHTAIEKALELLSKTTLVAPSITYVDWKRFTSLYQLLNHNQFLSLLARQNKIEEEHSKQNVKYTIDRPLREIITEMVAEELEINIADVDPTIPLFELGLDSVHSLGIRTDLEKLLTIQLSVSLIYDYNTIELLSNHLEELITDSGTSDKEIVDENEDTLLQLLSEELH